MAASAGATPAPGGGAATLLCSFVDSIAPQSVETEGLSNLDDLARQIAIQRKFPLLRRAQPRETDDAPCCCGEVRPHGAFDIPGSAQKGGDPCSICRSDLCAPPLSEQSAGGPDAAAVVVHTGTCGHTFHAGCLLGWLRTSHRCPHCHLPWAFAQPREHQGSCTAALPLDGSTRSVLVRLPHDHGETMPEEAFRALVADAAGKTADALRGLVLKCAPKRKDDTTAGRVPCVPGAIYCFCSQHSSCTAEVVDIKVERPGEEDNLFFTLDSTDCVRDIRSEVQERTGLRGDRQRLSVAGAQGAAGELWDDEETMRELLERGRAALSDLELEHGESGDLDLKFRAGSSPPMLECGPKGDEGYRGHAVVSVNGAPVTSEQEVREQYRGAHPGQRVVLGLSSPALVLTLVPECAGDTMAVDFYTSAHRLPPALPLSAVRALLAATDGVLYVGLRRGKGTDTALRNCAAAGLQSLFSASDAWAPSQCVPTDKAMAAMLTVLYVLAGRLMAGTARAKFLATLAVHLADWQPAVQAMHLLTSQNLKQFMAPEKAALASGLWRMLRAAAPPQISGSALLEYLRPALRWVLDHPPAGAPTLRWATSIVSDEADGRESSVDGTGDGDGDGGGCVAASAILRRAYPNCHYVVARLPYTTHEAQAAKALPRGIPWLQVVRAPRQTEDSAGSMLRFVGPLSLTARTPLPCITKDRDGHLAAFTGFGCGPGLQFFLPLRGTEDYFDAQKVAQRLAELGEDQAEGGEGAECERLAREAVVVCFDCSHSMCRSSSFVKSGVDPFYAERERERRRGWDGAAPRDDTPGRLEEEVEKFRARRHLGLLRSIVEGRASFAPAGSAARKDAAEQVLCELCKSERLVPQSDPDTVRIWTQHKSIFTGILAEGDGDEKAADEDADDDTPHEYLCPITREIMADPVTCPDGHSYERAALQQWADMGRNISPFTGQPLKNLRGNIVPNHNLRKRIEQWKQERAATGKDSKGPAPAAAQLEPGTHKFVLKKGPSESYGITTTDSLRISDIAPESPAAACRIPIGARITHAGGNPVFRVRDLAAAIARSSDGQLELEVEVEEPFQVFVRLPTEKSVTLEVTAGTTVRQLRERAIAKWGNHCPPSQLGLNYGGKHLQDTVPHMGPSLAAAAGAAAGRAPPAAMRSATMSDYCIERGATCFASLTYTSGTQPEPRVLVKVSVASSKVSGYMNTTHTFAPSINETLEDLYVRIWEADPLCGPRSVPSETSLWTELKDSGDGFCSGTHLGRDRWRDRLGDVLLHPTELYSARRGANELLGPVEVELCGRHREHWEEHELSRMEVTKQLFHAFINRSLAYDFPVEIGLVLFDSTATVACPISPLFENFRAQVDRAKPHGETCLYSAIHEAAKRLADWQQGPRRQEAALRILCLTDGADTKSTVEAHSVAAALQRANITLDAIRIGSDPPDRNLHAMVKSTGGYIFSPSSLPNALLLLELETMLHVAERTPPPAVPPVNSAAMLNHFADLHRFPLNECTESVVPARRHNSKLRFRTRTIADAIREADASLGAEEPPAAGAGEAAAPPSDAVGGADPAAPQELEQVEIAVQGGVLVLRLEQAPEGKVMSRRVLVAQRGDQRSTVATLTYDPKGRWLRADSGARVQLCTGGATAATIARVKRLARAAGVPNNIADALPLCDTASARQRVRHIISQLRAQQRDGHPNFRIFPSEDIGFWRMVMTGPEGTPYRGGCWLLYMDFPEEYPDAPPELRFVTPIKHCNINSYGRVCHSIFDRNYTRETTVRTLLDCAYGLLLTPDVADPLDSTLALSFYDDSGVYEESIARHTERHAMARTAEEWTELFERGEMDEAAELARKQAGCHIAPGTFVVASELMGRPELNGVVGRVVGMQGDRVQVEFTWPHGMAAIRMEQLSVTARPAAKVDEILAKDSSEKCDPPTDARSDRRRRGTWRFTVQVGTRARDGGD
eukprot:TRINITY_DN541_c0_g1_i6.p1 TRINITY_DN541_c0_g1~~TRINITY_DN541_c0_g1_i6.p1  ORF type:complete len:1950 (+),score=620.65 TRINITY_DN541_c0_g1_i6:99-5948(+)